MSVRVLRSLLTLILLTTAVLKLAAQNAAELGTQLHAAVKARETERALALIQQQAPLDVEVGGDSTLFVAIANRDVVLAKALLEAGASPTFAGSNGVPPLEMAAQMSQVELVKLLLTKYKAPVGPSRSPDYTALHAAADFNSDETITLLLLAAGADPRIVTEGGKTPIDLAAAQHKTAIVEALRQGSDPAAIARAAAAMTPAIDDPEAEARAELLDELREVAMQKLESDGFKLLEEGTIALQARGSHVESEGSRHPVFFREQYRFVVIAKDVLAVHALMNGTLLKIPCSDCETSISGYMTGLGAIAELDGYRIVFLDLALLNQQQNFVTFVPFGNAAGEEAMWLLFSKTVRR